MSSHFTDRKFSAAEQIGHVQQYLDAQKGGGDVHYRRSDQQTR